MAPNALPAYRSLRQSFWPTSFQPRNCDRTLVNEIRELVEPLKFQSDVELATSITELRSRVRSGESPLQLDILARCFSLVYEAVRRVTGLEYYDVQLLSGLALVSGAIAEMKTGEGKTIVAVLPAAAQALNGNGVHVATVNSYLAGRDYELLAPAFELLGFSCGHAKDQDTPVNKRAAYACDVTYGTGYEFGFDYLRDQAEMRSLPKLRLGETLRSRLRGAAESAGRTVQRGQAFAVIDEVDSVLIDEASTPLVLSTDPGKYQVDETPYHRALELANLLNSEEHYVIDFRRRTIWLTDPGQHVVFQSHASLPVEGLVRPWQTYVEQALRAKLLLQNEVDYVIQDGEIRIVDQYTGRIFTDRTWRDGLHQAVETKEGVTITHEKSSIGRISRQRYFGFYETICGMTGTATGHERELYEFYGVPIVIIPERLPNQRQALPTRFFVCLASKWEAIAEDVTTRYRAGQPVLVGTRTIDESTELAKRLKARAIPHQVLNGLQSEDEADLIARAGQLRAVTIATNMAGRGTDIKISKDVVELGGLHVIATQRQESRRVDRQLVGRSARQGEPGSCQCFVSAEDELIQQFDPRLGDRMSASDGRQSTTETADGEIHEDFQRHVDRVQQRAERQRLQQRGDLYRQDQWLNEVLSAVAQKDTPAPDIGTRTTSAMR